MIIIKRVRIQNFRSIVDATLDFRDMNCFVGMNDSGKSNVLKALNLFFNNKTDYNREFSFSSDYSLFSNPGKHHAREIVITVVVDVPDRYHENGEKRWKRVWRKDGLHSDNLDSLFSPRSKALSFMKRIRYTYIPAIRSNEYFKYLLSQVYLSMTGGESSKLSSLNDTYSKELSDITSELTEAIKANLSITSSIKLPNDMRVLFEDMSFSTSDDNVNGVDLNFRGDGIKSRHVPSIIRYTQKNHNDFSANRFASESNIWGFEEPENGIEFYSCYSLAEELANYSRDTQIIISTHSPAFYSLVDRGAAISYR